MTSSEGRLWIQKLEADDFILLVQPGESSLSSVFLFLDMFFSVS